MPKVKNPLSFLEKSEVVAGWVDGNLTADEAYAHLLAKKATGQNQPSIKRPVTLALIARTLNYGREPGETLEGRKYGRIPARPFMDLAMENFRKKLPKILKYNLPKVLNKKMTQKALLTQIGERMAGEIKEAMTNGDWQPLAPATLRARRHGGDKPLIDTGTLRSSVSFEIRKK